MSDKQENDRYILIILELKRKKNRREMKYLETLTKKYPDNEIYRDKVIKELSNRGFITYINSDAYQDKTGSWEYKYPDLPKYFEATKRGEMALKNNLFPSELKQKARDKRFRNMQFIGVVIAAFAGLITIFSFFYKHVQ